MYKTAVKHLLVMVCMGVLATTAIAKNHQHPTRHTVKRVVTKAAFSSSSFLIADANGNVLKEYKSGLVRPIASISKLLLGLVVVEQDLSELLNIPAKRTVHSGIPRTQLQLTREELLTLSLVKSDNFAALILCQNIPNCIDAMNRKAQSLGMTQTFFEEPTGLSQKNVSTASDLLKLMLAASTNHTLTQLSSMSSAEITAGKNIIKIRNTNPLTSTLDIILSKTGFTNPAGGCISMMIGSNKGSRIVILLGSRNTRTRINESLKLYKDSVI